MVHCRPQRYCRHCAEVSNQPANTLTLNLLLTCPRLHKEICDFFEFMSPRNFEEAARQDLIVRLQRSLRSWQGNGSIARNADVICFGSFASGLYLPTADMDVVAITPQYTQTGIPSLGASMSQLRKLAEHFTKSGMAKPGSATFIWGAKVPLVKFVDRQTGLKVDMSFENDSGYMALDTFKTWKSQYPAMPVLVAIIKQMLAMRGLNEVFNGGIGGFTTICLVVHVLQTMPELQAGSMDSTQHYGELLMKFLDLYGNKFNYHEVGIMMRHPYLFDKAKTRVPAKINMERLTIIDPNRADNDIAGGSRHIKIVFDCFRHAFNEMQRELGRVHSGKINVKSILDCIIGGNYESIVNQRQRLQDLFGSHAETVSPLPPPPPPAPVASAPQQARPKSNPRNKAGKQQGLPAQSLQANNGYVHPLAANAYNGVPNAHPAHPVYPYTVPSAYPSAANSYQNGYPGAQQHGWYASPTAHSAWPPQQYPALHPPPGVSGPTAFAPAGYGPPPQPSTVAPPPPPADSPPPPPPSMSPPPPPPASSPMQNYCAQQ